MVDRLQRITCRPCKVGRRSPRQSTQQYDALVVGDRGDGIDHPNSWRLGKGTYQQRARLGPAQSRESARRRHADIVMEIAHQVQQCRGDLGAIARQLAGIGTNCRIGVAQEWQH